MQVNELPVFDQSDNPTGCCPRFNPEGWDRQDLHFRDKLFLRVTTHSENFVPTDMGPVFAGAFAAMQQAGALSLADYIVLSRDLSPDSAEHLFAAAASVPGYEMVRLSGDFTTRVFEGPYTDGQQWLASLAAQTGASPDQLRWFYTTCPRCAEYYGRNYVVGVAPAATA